MNPSLRGLSGPVTNQLITPFLVSTSDTTPQCVMGQPHDIPMGRPINTSPFFIPSSLTRVGLYGKIVSFGPISPSKMSRIKSNSRLRLSFHPNFTPRFSPVQLRQLA